MFLLLLLLSVGLATASCPFGGSYFDKTGHCYVVSKLKAQWGPANAICRNLGGHLVVVDNRAENDFVFSAASKLLPAGNVFIGMFYNESTFAETNVDRSVVTFTNFQKSPGSLGPNAVVLMNSDVTKVADTLNFGKWQISQDVETVVNNFICEIPACENDSPAESLLVQPKIFQPRWKDGLYYGLLTESWYYGNPASTVGVPLAKAACESIGGYLPLIDGVAEDLEVVLAAKAANVGNAVPIGYGSDFLGRWSWDDGKKRTFTEWLRLPNLTFPLVQENQRAVLQLDTTLWISTIQQDLTNLVAKGFVCQLLKQPKSTCK